MTQRTDECKATHDELCNQMQKHYDSLSAYGCEFHSGIPRAIEFYRQNAERSLPTTSGDEELVEGVIKASENDSETGDYRHFYVNVLRDEIRKAITAAKAEERKRIKRKLKKEFDYIGNKDELIRVTDVLKVITQPPITK